MTRFLLRLLPVFLLCTATHAQTSDPAKHLLPVPQKVSLSAQRHALDDRWRIETSPQLTADDPALVSLTSTLHERWGLKLNRSAVTAGAGPSIRLSLAPGAVTIGPTIDRNRDALQAQAYRLKLDPNQIAITANGAAGLFYGVQTLLQLLQPEGATTTFVAGEITDWPELELRMMYWDDAHHLERLAAMKRAIKEASRYKINAFALKLEGHFQFKGASALVEPYAYTPAEYQELTDYARAHHMELVPYLDAPAHVSFILKHPEYAPLRALPSSNYEISVTNPKADELILGMFDELLAANQGGKYVFLSTDEAYHVGKVESEKQRAAELGGNTRLLADYITRLANALHANGRKVMIWVEYPLTLPDLEYIPAHLINAMYNEEWAPRLTQRGIRQMVYTSFTGQMLFPSYNKPPPKRVVRGAAALPLTDDEQARGGANKGRIEQSTDRIQSALAAGKSDFMGVIAAGWADRGLHPETFWLGYATVCATGWNRTPLPLDELTGRFYRSFYGPRSVNMSEVYARLSDQAEFWNTSWDWENSRHRSPIIGSSAGIFETPKPAKDQSLPALPVPAAENLAVKTDWLRANQERLLAAEKSLRENDALMRLLQENLERSDDRLYNLQVLRSVAQLCRQNATMLLDLRRIVESLGHAATVASTHPAVAVAWLDQALDQARRIRDERNEVLQAVTAVWYQDWHPRVAEANGRRYLDQLDDVKDHEPVRTVDMSYLIYRQLKYPLGQWAEETTQVRNRFAQEHHLPGRADALAWDTY